MRVSEHSEAAYTRDEQVRLPSRLLKIYYERARARCLARASQVKQWKCLRICLAGCAPHSHPLASSVCECVCGCSCAVHKRRVCSRSSVATHSIVCHCGCRRRRVRAFTVQRTNDFNLWPVNCQPALPFYFSSLSSFSVHSHARSSHQPSNGKIIPPSIRERIPTTTTAATTTPPEAQVVCEATTTSTMEKILSKENGAVVDLL